MTACNLRPKIYPGTFHLLDGAHSAHRPVHPAQDEGQFRLWYQFVLSGDQLLKATALLHVAGRIEVSFEGNQTRTGKQTLRGYLRTLREMGRLPGTAEANRGVYTIGKATIERNSPNFRSQVVRVSSRLRLRILASQKRVFNEPSFLVSCESRMGIAVGHDHQGFTAFDPFGGRVRPNQLLWSRVNALDLQH